MLKHVVLPKLKTAENRTKPSPASSLADNPANVHLRLGCIRTSSKLPPELELFPLTQFSNSTCDDLFSQPNTTQSNIKWIKHTKLAVASSPHHSPLLFSHFSISATQFTPPSRHPSLRFCRGCCSPLLEIPHSTDHILFDLQPQPTDI